MCVTVLEIVVGNPHVTVCPLLFTYKQSSKTMHLP